MRHAEGLEEYAAASDAAQAVRLASGTAKQSERASVLAAGSDSRIAVKRGAIEQLLRLVVYAAVRLL